MRLPSVCSLWYLVIMSEDGKKNGPVQVGVEQLLGRGSRILGLASVAGACGQRAGKGPWYVLSEETVSPTEEVMTALEKNPDPVLLESAVRAALENEPATSLPAWTKPILDGTFAVSHIGEALEQGSVSKIVAGRGNTTSNQITGLAALAIGFCRSRDNLDVLSRNLDDDNRKAVTRMGALAGVIVEPGEPSRMRRRLKKLLKENAKVIDG